MPSCDDRLNGYVLHRQPYRESSYLMDLWTREQGRLRVIAKSARGPRSRFRGQLEPFTPLQFRLAGRHSLKVVAEADVVGLPIDLPGSNLFCAFYLNELLLRLCSEASADPVLFACYEQTLKSLSSGDVLTPLRYFEIALLCQLGYGIDFARDVQGAVIESDALYLYQCDAGFIRCDQPSRSDVFSGELLLLLAQEQLIPKQCEQAAKRLMRQALRPYLGEKPMKSQEAFVSVD